MRMLESNRDRNLTRRPWYRLHLSTWLTLPFGLVVAVMVVVPGDASRNEVRPTFFVARPKVPTGPTNDVGPIIHGWPLPFLWRAPQKWNGDPSTAATSLPWRLTDSVREFHWLPLLVDLAVAGFVLAVFAALVERRRRKRSRLIQFSLRELLIISLLFAVGLGWWNHRRQVKDRLSRIDGATKARFVPQLPLWLRIAAGDDALSRLGLNGPVGPIVLPWGLSRRDEIQSIVEQFPRETIVEMDNTVSSDDAAAVGAIRRLEQIRCVYQPTTDLTQLLSALERHPHLRDFEYIGGLIKINDAQLAQIATLSQLESLSVHSNASQLTEKGLASLRNCKKLEQLELDGARLTTDAMACFSEMKQLRRLDLTAAQFINADLSTLPPIDGLEELVLAGTNLDDDDALQLRAMPSLRRLNIVGTQMTAAGVKEMLDPSTQVSARNSRRFRLMAI